MTQLQGNIIVAGSITANRIVANSIPVGKIQMGDETVNVYNEIVPSFRWGSIKEEYYGCVIYGASNFNMTPDDRGNVYTTEDLS